MELRQLTYFAKTAELRSVSRAAAALHITQPSLSRQISALERELGCPLLYRTSRGVTLTPQGRALARHLTVVFAQVQRIPEVLKEAANEKELVRVGVPQGLPHEWAAPMLRAIERRLPGVRLSLHEGTTEEQRQQLQTGLLDLGLVHLDAPELHTRHVLTQPMGVAVPPHSELRDRASLAFADLDGLTVMAHAAGEISSEEAHLQAAAEAEDSSIHWVFRRFSAHSGLIARAAQVDGVLSTETSATRHLADWVWVPLRSEVDGSRLHTWIAWVAPLSPAAAAVIDVMAMPLEALAATTPAEPSSSP